MDREGSAAFTHIRVVLLGRHQGASCCAPRSPGGWCLRQPRGRETKAGALFVDMQFRDVLGGSTRWNDDAFTLCFFLSRIASSNLRLMLLGSTIFKKKKSRICTSMLIIY